MPGGNDHGDRPESALEEVLREVEEAEKRDEEKASTAAADDDPNGTDNHSGEAGDAITPNIGAQEQAKGD